MSEALGKKIRFGPFEADLGAGELRKNGRQLRMQEQPFQILVALLERPGEIVTRDELRERLWAGDTFVDFDQGLNTAINKLRETLGDSASTPRFIETVPKRGYRFTFPLEPLMNQPAIDTPKPAGPAWRNRRLLLAIAICLVIGAVAVVGIALDRAFRGRNLVMLGLVPLTSGVAAALTPVGPALYPAVMLVGSRGKYFAEWQPAK